jgi:F0F1-type ATP synthase assembly protein I
VSAGGTTASVWAAMAERKDDDEKAVAYGGSQGMNQGMQVLSYLISGVVLYGGLGWLGDHFLGTGFLLPVGIILGAGFGIYLVVKRFGETAGSAAALPATTRPDETTTDTQVRRKTGEGTT